MYIADVYIYLIFGLKLVNLGLASDFIHAVE